MTETSSRFLLPLLEAGQAQKEITHNEALVLIDAALGASVVDCGVETPPEAPAAGQCWLIGPAPSGAWAGHPSEIAVWTGGGWRFLPARTGMVIWVESGEVFARRTATEWLTGSWPVTELVIGGVGMLTGRLAGIALPAGGATVDLQARAAISAVIAALQSHGLIE
jgi:hypothetical protein